MVSRKTCGGQMPTTVRCSESHKVTTTFFCVALMLASSSLLGCSANSKGKNNPNAAISGEVVLNLLQPAGQEELDNIFIVTPETGRVRRASIDALPHARPTGNISSCYKRPSSASLDGKFIATCDGPVLPSMSGSPPDVFSIIRTDSTPVACRGLQGHQIIGFLWSPDSKAVAVLSTTVRVSLNPRYWFYALSGHPAQFEKYHLNVVDPATLTVSSFEIPFETRFGRAQLLEWRKL